ncbi:MAG: S-layer homology domain-containing protein [Desulfotomaculaceae bacterium]|nr:S-layer homology domain-containing protein [Desulfotomaculaceae bacterium]
MFIKSTRAKTKALIVLVLALLMLFSLTGLSCAQPIDIQGHWAESEISSWVSKGFVTGYQDGTFKPDNSISRAEFVTLVNRSFGFTNSANTNFSDVLSTDWFAGEIARAKAVGYVSGYEDGTFRPNAEISRQEVATMLARMLKLEPSTNFAAVSKFKDAGDIPQWSKGFIDAVVSGGLMNGYPDLTFLAGQAITRAEAVITLDKAVTTSGKSITIQPGTQGQTSGTNNSGGSGSQADSDTINISNILATNTLGKFKFDTDKVTTVSELEGKILADGIATKTFAKRDTGEDGKAWNCFIATTPYEKDRDYVITCLDPFKIKGENTVRWSSSEAAPAALNVAAEDVGNNGNGSDLEVSFGGPKGQNTRITTYRIMVVKSDDASSFTLSAANDVSSGNYTTVEKEIDRESYVKKLSPSARDVDGKTITTGVAYKVFVLSVADGSNAKVNALSKPSNEITLIGKSGGSGGGGDDDTPEAPVYVSSEVTTKGDVSITFSKEMADPSGKQAQFAVTVDGVENVVTAVQSTDTPGKIKLVLTTKVTAGQVVTVTYTKGVDNASRVKSSDGGVLDSFGPEVVTNKLSGVVPVYVSSEVTTKGDVSITFSKEMADPSGKQAQFTVTVDGVENVVTAVQSTDTPSKIKLVLTTKVTGDQAVTVTYTKGIDDAGQIKSADGGVLDSFGPVSVGDNLPGAAPVYVSSEVTTKGDVSITFNKDMADPAGKQAQFAVTVDGIENVVTAVQSTETPNKIKLVLTTKVTGDQAVTVTYTRGADNASQVKSADGGVLESFGPEAVTNNLPGAAPVYVSAEVTNKGDVSILFDKDMADPAGKQAQFVVTVDGVENVVTEVQSTNTPNKIKLVLTTKVTGSHAVTLAYTKGADDASQVKSVDGGVLESFGPVEVSNNS